MKGLTPNEKGAIAEARIIAAAIDAGIVVLRPLVDGRRYDVLFDFDGDRLERVQCKWGRLVNDVIIVATGTCRHSPTRGYVRTTYDPSEIDAFAVYCAALDRCYYLPAGVAMGKMELRLRVNATRNNQQAGVTMAADYEFGAVAQLGERRRGTPEATGSSPVSSIA